MEERKRRRSSADLLQFVLLARDMVVTEALEAPGHAGSVMPLRSAPWSRRLGLLSG